MVLARALADVYNSRLPNVMAAPMESSGSEFSAEAVENGDAELGIIQADVGYSAFLGASPTNATPHTRLRVLANLYPSVVQVVVMADSGITSVRELQDRGRIAASDSSTYAAARLILQAYDLEDQIAQEYDGATQASIAEALAAGRIIAGIIVAYAPSPPLVEFSRTNRLRVLPLDPDVVTGLRAAYPFFRKFVIPEGTYRGEAGVPTVAVDTLLVCRSDLPDALVSQLARLFSESAAELSASYPTLVLDADGAFASPIPVHPGALRYYRERELFR